MRKKINDSQKAILEKMKKRFDASSITTVFSTIDDYIAEYEKGQRKFAESLFYLKKENRHKELKKYKDYKFEQFVKSKYGLSIRECNKLIYIWVMRPEETKEYGIDVMVEAYKLPAGDRENALAKLKKLNNPTTARKLEIVNNFKTVRNQSKKPEEDIEKKLREKIEEIEKLKKQLVYWKQRALEAEEQIQELETV